MLERVGSESKTQMILPLSSSPKLSWVEWKTYLFIFAATIALGNEALTTSFVEAVESVAAKVARLAKYAMANALLVMTICQSAMYCDDARAVVTSFQRCQTQMEVHSICPNYLRPDLLKRQFKSYRNYW